jgi:hypothetical protein
VATYYVDSNATGLNDGSSWTDAWTSLASSLSVAAGDTVLVASNHSEFSTVTRYFHYNSTLSSPIRVISTNKTSGAYERGAFIRCSNGHNQDIRFSNARFYGIDSEHDRRGGFGHASGVLYMSDCTFTQINTNGNGGFYGGENNIISECFFDGCTFDISTSHPTTVFRISRDARHFIFNNCTVTAGQYQSSFIGEATRYNGLIRFSSCDISSVPDISFNIFSGRMEVSKCNIPSSWIINSTVVNPSRIEITDCYSGTISGNSSNYQNRTTYGKSARTTTEYRANGANDSIDDYSLKIESDSTALEVFNASISPDISKYVETGSQTITVYVAGSSSLTDDDFWIEVESPSEEVSPTAQGKFRTTKPEPLATPTALTSDTSSTWNGSGVGTKQKIEVAISPTIAGTVTVRCYLAKPSTTVYVDPKISTTGNQRVFNGVLIDTDESLFSVAGGGSSSPTYTSTAGTQMYPFRTLAEDDFDKGRTKFHPLS